MSTAIWTVGHSNRDIKTFTSLLADQSVELLVDVRRFPSSRRHPQFDCDALGAQLHCAGIEYRHFAALGGRRTGRSPGSLNTAWRAESFNAYADYMETPEFKRAFAELIALAEQRRTAVMCAEALPWRCHRRLIADALIVQGWTVQDIIGPGKVVRHSLTEFARVLDGRLVYPAEPLFADEERRRAGTPTPLPNGERGRG